MIDRNQVQARPNTLVNIFEILNKIFIPQVR